MPKIQSIELKIVKKLKGTSKDIPVPHGREKKAIISGKVETLEKKCTRVAGGE